MIIVTGGSGFIGSNIIREFNRRSLKDIVIVDNLSRSSKYLNINSLSFIDYIDKKELLNWLPSNKAEIDLIVHQGACSSTVELDGNYMIENNLNFSKKLLLFSVENEIDFMYASSASVYGDGKRGFREDPDCERPLNVYAFSKWVFDNYVRSFLKENDVKSQVLGLRYFNVFGYQENHKGEMASAIYHFYRQLRDCSSIKIFEGSDSFFRDFIFIDDVIDVFSFFLETKKNGIYNCGTGTERTFLNIAEIIQQLEADQGRSIKIDFIPFPDKLKGKYQSFTKADLAKLRSQGYDREFRPLEKGIEVYYNCLRNTNGYFK